MKTFWLLFICLFYHLSARGQYRFISFGVADGLSQNSVHCIYQDGDGLLWLGTQDGLNSFDGRNFKSYKYDASDSTTLSDQFVLSITQDLDGYIWVATRSGLNRLNKHTGIFKRFYDAGQNEAGIGRSYAHLERSTQGDILADCSAVPAVLQVNKKQITRLPLDRHVYHPVFDPSGNVWGVNSLNELVHSARSGNFKTKIVYPPHPYFPSREQVNTLSVGGHLIWCYTTSGKGKIFVFDPVLKKWQKEYITLPDVINDIIIDKRGTAWVATLNGVYLIKKGRITQHLYNKTQTHSGLPAGSILSACEDIQGNLWLGSSNGGFAYYHPDFDHFDVWSTDIQHDAVTCMASLGEDEKWIGTNSGLYKMTKDKGSPATSIHFFAGHKVTALTKDARGNLWVALQKEGLLVIDRNGIVKQKLTRHDPVLQTKNILHLSADSKGRIWAAGERGFFVYESGTGKWRSFYQDPYDKGLPSGWYVLNVFEDDQQRVWVCKQFGVDVYSSSLRLLFSISSKKNESPIGRTIITGVSQDKWGTIWISTLSNGVYTCRNGLIEQHFTTSQGLNSNVVYGIVCDNAGRVWTTTTAGINVYDPSQQRFYSLGYGDGLQSSDYSMGAVMRDEDGNILMGSTSGLVIANASAIGLQKKTAEARISEIAIDGKSIEDLAKPLLLHSGYQMISFSFSLRQALQPRKIIYQVRMKGAESGWTTVPPGVASISYSKLPFTKLVMQVRAAYFFADLTDAPVKEYPIEVQPAFWQSNWFFMLMILVGALLIAGIVQAYNRKEFKKQLDAIVLQRELQQERGRIGRDLHDNIGAYTSALIAGINRIRKNEQREDAGQLAELSEYASGIMGYLRETIWVLNQETISVTAFCDRFIDYANRIIRHYPAVKLSFTETITNGRSLTPQLSLHLFRILQEALQNACKHAEASCIEIGFGSDESMYFYVIDNGKGLSDGLKKDVYGLQGMRLRAEQSGFDIAISSVNGSGTTVRLTEK